MNGQNKIRYSFENIFSVTQLKELYESVGWMSAAYAGRMVKAFKKAGTVVSAWDGEKLVGLAEVLDDGELTAYIHYLLVRPEYQGQGVGRRMLQMVRKQYKEYLYLVVISEKGESVKFYEKCGFLCKDKAAPLMILNCKSEDGN